MSWHSCCIRLIRDAVAAAAPAIDEGSPETGRVLAISNSRKGPTSYSEKSLTIPPQAEMANWLRDRDSNPEPCG
jgi:hypothetical protein